jgi:hypothetical protein
MKNFVGKFYEGKWNSIVDSLKDKEGSRKAYGENFYINADGRFNPVINLWETAGYSKIDVVEWINYYPEKDFDNTVVTDFETFSNTTCARAWISMIRPGKMAPWHLDVDDNQEGYLKLGNLVRYTCHICTPSPGQVFMLDQEVFYCEEQGNTYQWPSYDSWHAGSNSGFTNKYMFNFLGIVK